jgi:hypothetical protein
MKMIAALFHPSTPPAIRAAVETDGSICIAAIGGGMFNAIANHILAAQLFRISAVTTASFLLIALDMICT